MVEVSALSMPPGCPRCGQFDMVQQVAGIVASQNTPLSWELRAPMLPGTTAGYRQRRSLTSGWGCVAALVLLTLPLDIVVLIVLAAVAAVVIVAITAVALVGAAGYGLYRYLNRHVIAERRLAEERRQAETARRYRHALGYWNQLRYCYRCHGVFLPGNEWQHRAVTVPGALAPPAHAWALSERLADYVDRQNAPEVLRLEGR
jgi:hypothetical protein